MKLIQLQYFQAACQYRNITRAAEALHVSQPSISNAIKELEDEFGVTLFHRLNKGFTLTEEGMQLLGMINGLLEQADKVCQVMSDLGQKRNLIRLGVPPMIGTFLFPKIYKGFSQQYPEVKLLTQEDGSSELLDSLQKDILDIAILPSNNISSGDFNILDITRTETLFCVSEHHRLASAKNVSIKDIKDEPLIMFNTGFYQNQVIKDRFQEYGISPVIIHYSGQLQTIKQFIVENIAAGFLFREIAEASPGIVGISLDKPIIIKISLVWKRSRHMFNDMIRFINYIKSIIVF